MRFTKLFSMVMLLLAILGLSACDPSAPSQMNTSKIRVKDQMVVRTLDANHIDQGEINDIADNFIKNGSGELTLNVSYLSGDRSKRVLAEKNGAAYKEAFNKRGVKSLSFVATPVDKSEHANKLVVAYYSHVALPPKECSPITGNRGAETLEAAKHYEFGCHTKMNLSKMIVEPTDLLGKTGKMDGDSRRLGATVEQYKAGVPNSPMGGYSASEVGN